MRKCMIILLAIPFLGSAPPTAGGADGTALAVQPQPWTAIPHPSPADDAVCQDRIRQVRSANGLPSLERGPVTSGNEGLLYWAVDHRHDGCGVLVMKGRPGDIRPVPPAADHAEMIPAGR